MNVDLVRAVIDDFCNKIEHPPDPDEGECESPIEAEFLWAFRKVVKEDVRISKQRKVETQGATYRLDFLVESIGSGEVIGVECDGRDFHFSDRDSRRDKAIIAAGVVDKIFRIKGCDIYSHLADTIELLGALEPWLLSERGITNLSIQSYPSHLKEDYWGPNESHFPFAAFRYYTRPCCDEDREVDSEDGSRFSYKPTIIQWTERRVNWI